MCGIRMAVVHVYGNRSIAQYAHGQQRVHAFMTLPGILSWFKEPGLRASEQDDMGEADPEKVRAFIHKVGKEKDKKLGQEISSALGFTSKGKERKLESQEHNGTVVWVAARLEHWSGHGRRFVWLLERDLPWSLRCQSATRIR